MDARQRDTLFGRMALRVGWITIEQLNAATEEQGRRQYPPPLGELFVELGFLTPEKVQKLLKRQQDIMAERAARGGAPADAPAERAAAESGDNADEQEQARQIAARARREAEAKARREAEEQARQQQEMQEQMQRDIEAQLQAQLEAQLAAQLAPPPAPPPAAVPAAGRARPFNLTPEPPPEAAAPAAARPKKQAALDPFPDLPPPQSRAAASAPQPIAAVLHEALADELDDDAPQDTSASRLDSQLNRAMPIRSDEAPAEDRPEVTPLPARRATTPAAVSGASEGTGEVTSAWLASVLTNAALAGASDVHLHAGSPIALRVLGELRPISNETLDATALEGELRSVLNAAEAHALDELGQVDLALTLPGVARFRGNIYKQQRGMDGAFRVVPPRAPTLAELGLPQQIARVTTYHQGIVLFTGPAGCGKSATMAAIVDLINAERTDHILTIEDPIEIVHTPKRAIVNQRHAGFHTKTYARALRGALREDPDVIVIGEMRDYETISLALKAAETGHLVLATLHTNSAARTINRIVGAFPPNQQGQARSMLSESLRAVISQRLVVRADGAGRVPAIEVLYVNPAVGNLIRDNRTVQLRSVLQTQTAQGMCLLDASLADLIKRGVIKWADAAVHAEDARKLPGAPAGGAAAGGA